MNQLQHVTLSRRTGSHMPARTDGNDCLNFQEQVHRLERQLRDMEKEKEREMNALRKEKRELIHTQMVCGICQTVGFTNLWSLFNWCSFYCDVIY